MVWSLRNLDFQGMAIVLSPNFGYHTFKGAAHIGERNPTWKLVH